MFPMISLQCEWNLCPIVKSEFSDSDISNNKAIMCYIFNFFYFETIILMSLSSKALNRKV